MRRRANPEADLQRNIVSALRMVLPPDGIVHHSPHEQRAGDKRARLAQAIGVGMGVQPGWPDLMVVSSGIVVFLEVKTKRGSLSEDQRDVCANLRAQGFHYAVVRSEADALQALGAAGVKTRVVGGL